MTQPIDDGSQFGKQVNQDYQIWHLSQEGQLCSSLSDTASSPNVSLSTVAGQVVELADLSPSAERPQLEQIHASHFS